MLKEAMRFFLDKTMSNHVEIDGVHYWKHGEDLKFVELPVPDTLYVCTLEDFVAAVAVRKDTVEVIRVVSPTHVQALTALSGSAKQDFAIVSAMPDTKCTYHEHVQNFENGVDAICWLNANFISCKERDATIEYLSTYKLQNSEETTFDGITHRIKYTSGHAEREVTVQNPVNLTPLHTMFKGITEPKIPFIFTMDGRHVKFEPAADLIWIDLKRKKIQETIKALLDKVDDLDIPIV